MRVGKSNATDLYNIGIRHIEDLKGKDQLRPESPART
jgi:hypothetical protein